MLGLRETNDSRVHEMVGLRYAAGMTESRWQRESTVSGLPGKFLRCGSIDHRERLVETPESRGRQLCRADLM
jgi:hypothetical protein